MKYILAMVGMVIGQIIGMLTADSRLINWALGLIGGVVGYFLAGFIRYARSTPQQILSFHGPNAPISRSTSSGELQAFLSQLHKGGLLLKFHPKKSDVSVDGSQWANLHEPEKLTLFQVLARAQIVNGYSTQEIKLFNRDGTLLAKYSTIYGTMSFIEKRD